VKVLAHRGANRRAPENTVAAFAIARDLGADGVELDVHPTADGVLVVHHDAIATGLGTIQDFPLVGVALARPDIPTLAAVLDVCAGMLVNIELKNFPGDADFDPEHGPATGVVELLRARTGRVADGAGDDVIVSSFNLDTIDRVHALDPSVPTGFLTIAGFDPMFALDVAAERGHVALHPQLLALGEDATPVMTRARELGLRVNVWTVNDAEAMRTLRDAGAYAVITDVPDLALATLNP
jgi:glycerophosphoryl diester phosphodiesterase